MDSQINKPCLKDKQREKQSDQVHTQMTWARPCKDWTFLLDKGKIYLLRNIVCCFVCHVEICQVTTPLAKLLVSLESPWWVGVHLDGLIMFRLAMPKLLNFEHFCQRKFNESKTKYFKESGVSSFVLLENPWWMGFLEDDFVILDLKWGKYWILNNFIIGN
jgi:hypothetical protein